MCMYDNCDEIVTPLSDAWHTARIAHRCEECRRDIDPGERYHADRYLFEGQFHNHKVCAHCMVVRGWLSDECGGWIFGGVLEDIREHAHENYPMDVQRLAVGMGWKWSTPSGKRLPVPAIPLTTMQRAKATA